MREKGANLSASLRSRVALARALAAEPRLLLIDDPSFFADASTRAVLDDVLTAVDATVLVVAPDPAALSGVDRVWQLEGGCIGETRRIRAPRLAMPEAVGLGEARSG